VSSPNIPLIFSDFNDWQPEPMTEIFVFCEFFEKRLDVE